MTSSSPLTQTVHSLADLAAFAVDLVESLSPKETGATLVTLSGELGAGKTTFTQNVARALGVETIVTSPTFVLEKIYPLPVAGNGFSKLVHIDAYRLESEGEHSLAPLGFSTFLTDTAALIMLEWPELVASQLPVADVHITLVAHPDESRTLSYTRIN